MKIAKYIISVVVILFCFALGSELYQAHLQNFSNRFFYIEIDAEDREAVYGVIMAATEKYGEKVFAVERRDLDAYHSELVVYADEDMQENLVAQQDIIAGDAGSLFSGGPKSCIGLLRRSYLILMSFAIILPGQRTPSAPFGSTSTLSWPPRTCTRKP